MRPKLQRIIFILICISILPLIGEEKRGQYVYHHRKKNFTGNYIIPLNRMADLEEFAGIHKRAIAKYEGREQVLERVIPTLNCLWNDVVFLSPLHPHKHYLEYQKLGFEMKDNEFFKIPVEMLSGKRVTIWNWPEPRSYSSWDDYSCLNIATYREMQDLPEDTKEYYLVNFDSGHPDRYPIYNWYRIPHILCQDPIDISDERVSIINWKDPIN